MEFGENDNYFSSLLAKKIIGNIDKAEDEALLKWSTESKENAEIYNSVLNKSNIANNVKKLDTVNVESNLNDVVQKISFPKNHSSIFKFRYVAIFAALALVSYALYRFWPDVDKSNVELVHSSEVVSGTSKAILVLSDGNEILLDSTSELSSISEPGAMIIKNGKHISYNNDIENTDAPALNKIIVPKAGEYQLTLSDGTTVIINSESELEFPVSFNDNVREVNLVGEAYFRVAHNDSVPFIVRSNGMSVKVLGTEFNIKAYLGDAVSQTTLINGSVELSYCNSDGSNSVYKLRPSEQASYNNADKTMSFNKADVEVVTAWINGQFLFRNDRLEDILNVLARWYDFDVTYVDQSIKDMTFAGRLNRSGALQPILDIISSTRKLTIVVDNHHISISH